MCGYGFFNSMTLLVIRHRRLHWRHWPEDTCSCGYRLSGEPSAKKMQNVCLSDRRLLLLALFHASRTVRSRQPSAFLLLLPVFFPPFEREEGCQTARMRFFLFLPCYFTFFSSRPHLHPHSRLSFLSTLPSSFSILFSP